jgi:penicillin-binding protein 1A
MKVLFKLIKIIFYFLVFSSIAGSIVASIVFLIFSSSLPKIITIEDYKPPIVSELYGQNNEIVGEFYEEKRYILPIEKIPEIIQRAFISAEDDRFFEHQGIDLMGILRAALTNLKAGRVVQGGSTITQQVAKSLLLSSERSFNRKIKEVILSYRMEKNLSKKDILYLYLNQIYLGQGAYGVEAAARTYFNKSCSELTIAEAAMLAGLPQAPSKYSPLHNPKKAKERQLYVLRRMFEDGVISESQYNQAKSEKIKIHNPKEITKEIAPYYAETIRKILYDKYGKDKLYHDGLKIYTAINKKLSLAADQAVKEGLREVDKKQGYRGPLKKISKQESKEKIIDEITKENYLSIFNYFLLAQTGDLVFDFGENSLGSNQEIDIFKVNKIYKGLVENVDDKKLTTIVRISKNIVGVLPLSKMKWAQPVSEPSSSGVNPISRPSQALHEGDVILVRVESVDKKTNKVELSLEQDPVVQAALLSMDVNTGEVLAMVGGYDFEKNEFNRALQAKRQPGSSYKPIIYSAALDKGYTPVTIIQDSPLVFDSGDFGKWKPENYEEKFYGDTTFRQALIKSRNIPTIRIVQDIGVPYLIEYTNRMGLKEGLTRDLSIALGTSSVSLLDNVSLYAIFARLGRKVKPIFYHTIKDRDGKVLEEVPLTPTQPPLNIELPKPLKPVKVCGELQTEIKNGVPEEYRTRFFNDPADPDRVIDPRTAFVMTHLMNEVATVGTGAKAKNLGRPAAGKTGTTNDYVDAWFVGFTPNIVTGVWTGFDTQKTIFPKATGAEVSLPIWLDFMKVAVEEYPYSEFTPPKGVVMVYIDPKTGKRVSPTFPGAVLEAFVEGTEPGGFAYQQNDSFSNTEKNTSSDSSKMPTQPTTTDSQAEELYKSDL